MNKYVCFYREKITEIEANTSFEAQKKAQARFKLRDNQRYKITVMLAETPEGEVVHRAVD